MDLTSFILSNLPQDSSAPVFIDADRRDRAISWQQYASNLKRVAVGLRDIGLSHQECVALLSPNDIYSGILADGVVVAGAIFAGLPASAKQSELISACQVADVKWLFATPQLLDQALSTARAVRIPENQVILFDPPGWEIPRQVDSSRLSFSHLLAMFHENDFANPNSSRDPHLQIASRLFTSGTTGSPKAVEVSHAAHIARIGPKEMCPSGSDVRLLHFIGMHHVSGITYRQRAAAGHFCMYITNAQNPADLIDLIRQYHIQSVLMPPRTMIAMEGLIRKGTRAELDIASLSYIVVGGSAVPNESLDAFKEILPSQANLRVGYGSTEMGTSCTGDWGGKHESHLPGYVGMIYDSVEAMIIEPETQRDLGFDTDGEICIFAPELFNGYRGSTQATQAALTIGAGGKKFFRTGDKGRLSAKGEICITGRFKEVFKVDTEEVAPAEVEAALLKHPEVKDAAVAATEDRNDARYHEVKAYVVQQDHATVTAQELVNYVAASLTPHKAPTGGVTLLAEIPRNAMKKVIRRELDTVEPLAGSAGYVDVQN